HESLGNGERVLTGNDVAPVSGGSVSGALSENTLGILTTESGDVNSVTFRLFDNDGNAAVDVEVSGAMSGNGIYNDIGVIGGAGGALGAIIVDLPIDTMWLVSGADSGFVAIDGFSAVSFSGIANLTGGANNKDTFIFDAEGTLSGLVDGGPGGFDVMALSGDTVVNTVTFSSTGIGSGTVQRDADVITYAGLEPIIDSTGGAKIFANTSVDPDGITVADIGTGNDNRFIVQNDAVGHESVTFTNASGITSLTINANDGNDTITLNALDAMFTGDVIVNAGGGADKVFVNAMTGTGDYTVSGDAGNDEFHSKVIPFAALTSLTFNGGADTDTLLYSGDSDFVLNANSFGETLTHPLFEINFSSVEKAIVIGRSLNATGYPGSAVLVDVSAVPTWQEQGPTAILSSDPSKQIPPFPQAGAVDAIAVHPFDSQIIFAGTVNGGVFRSVDGGSSWTPLTDDFPSLSIGALAINSHDADGNAVTDNYMGSGLPTPWQKLVVYAGTGQFSNNGDGGFSIGLLKSTTGGATWILLTSPEMAGLAITSIQAKRVGTDDVVLVGTAAASKFEEVASQTDSQQLTFAVANTITRTTGSWVTDGFKVDEFIRVSGTHLNDGVFSISAISPLVLTLAPQYVLANEVVPTDGVITNAGNSRVLTKKGGIFRSTNGGASFTKNELVAPGLGVIPFEDAIPAGSVTDIVQDPFIGADRYYAAVTGGGVYVSNNSGQTWSQVNIGLTLANDTFDNNGDHLLDDAGETAAGVLRIRLAVRQDKTSATNPVYASLIGEGGWLMGVFQSTNQGASWTQVSQAAPSPSASMIRPSTDTEMQLFAATNTIVRTNGSWIRDGFLMNQLVTISGATVAANNNTFTITGITPSTLTVNGPLANDPLGTNFFIIGDPPLTFNDLVNDTITRGGIGSFLTDGFMPGQTIGNLPIIGVTANTLTLGANLPAALLGTTSNGGVPVNASATFTANTTPQVNNGKQGEKNSALLADAAGNLYVVGDQPPHIYRWDAAGLTWSSSVFENANDTRPHADGRTLVMDARGNLLSGDDGGVYRLVNRNVTPLAVRAGDP
ncbi:MAG TPA: hypothetical protein VK210_13700, partial [Terriglobia bacterium]|nr:hypothetical protein [Terriglobia bacterium]